MLPSSLSLSLPLRFICIRVHSRFFRPVSPYQLYFTLSHSLLISATLFPFIYLHASFTGTIRSISFPPSPISLSIIGIDPLVLPLYSLRHSLTHPLSRSLFLSSSLSLPLSLSTYLSVPIALSHSLPVTRVLSFSSYQFHPVVALACPPSRFFRNAAPSLNQAEPSAEGHDCRRLIGACIVRSRLVAPLLPVSKSKLPKAFLPLSRHPF